jgi:hypothetical protein
MIITDAVIAEYLRLRAHPLTAAAPLTAHTEFRTVSRNRSDLAEASTARPPPLAWRYEVHAGAPADHTVLLESPRGI